MYPLTSVYLRMDGAEVAHMSANQMVAGSKTC